MKSSIFNCLVGVGCVVSVVFSLIYFGMIFFALGHKCTALFPVPKLELSCCLQQRNISYMYTFFLILVYSFAIMICKTWYWKVSCRFLGIEICIEICIFQAFQWEYFQQGFVICTCAILVETKILKCIVLIEFLAVTNKAWTVYVMWLLWLCVHVCVLGGEGGGGGGAGVAADWLSHKRSWNSIPSWGEWLQKVLKYHPIQRGVVIKEDHERSWNCMDLAKYIQSYPCSLLNTCR